VLHYDGNPITARFITRRSRSRRGAERAPVLPRRTKKGRNYLAKPSSTPDPAEKQGRYTAATTKARFRRCAGCGHDSISRAHPGVLRAGLSRTSRKLSYRLLVEDADYFLGNRTLTRHGDALGAHGANLATATILLASRRRRLGSIGWGSSRTSCAAVNMTTSSRTTAVTG